MLSRRLANQLGAPTQASDDVMAALASIPSQTSVEERQGLYSASRWSYSGLGEVLDIGCAAGGSSYCLAAGLRDSATGEGKRVECFDLFDGYSLRAFASRLPRDVEIRDDEQLFDFVTQDVAGFVRRHRMDLTKQFREHTRNRSVELAHIDAAKSLSLWRSIFAGLADTVIPDRTLWIFQDFERARLPWQIYGLSILLDQGDFVGGCHYGTMYFRFHEAIPDAVRTKIIDDSFTFAERIDGVRAVLDRISRDDADVFRNAWSLDSLERALIAYCHFHFGDKSEARSIYAGVEQPFRRDPANRMFEQELAMPAQ